MTVGMVAARVAGRSLAMLTMSAALALFMASNSAAQPTTPQPKPVQPKPVPKQVPKQQPAPPSPPAQPQDQQLPVAYTPWTKVCTKDQAKPESKEACMTIREVWLDTGQFVAATVLIEPKGEPKKILRITLPLGMMLKAGTRVTIDQGQPLQEQYVACLPNGCFADFEVTADFIGSLKKGKTLLLQAINLQGQVASFPLPIADFAKVNDGPSIDPKVLGEQQKKFHEDVLKRAEERKKREGQQPPAPR
jgi:invasion protein IalB